jgi:hypothetical protein
MSDGNNPPCETCLGRGRLRPGVYKVGAGWLCEPCWRGEGTPAERAMSELPPSVRETRRRYREKNIEKFRAYQRSYRLRRAKEGLPNQVGNQVLYEAGPNAVQAAPGP